VSEREPVREAGTTSASLVEDVWKQHGTALYVLARVVFNDAHDAERVVAQAILDACGRDDVAGDVDRRTLARHVFVLEARRRAELGRNPGPGPTSTPDEGDFSGVAAMSGLSYPERAVIAWGLLGAHTYAEIALFVGLPPCEVADLMRSGLLRMRDARGRQAADSS